MAQDGSTIMLEESRLTKGDIDPPHADLFVVSALLMDETRESKAKAYVTEELKKWPPSTYILLMISIQSFKTAINK